VLKSISEQKVVLIKGDGKQTKKTNNDNKSPPKGTSKGEALSRVHTLPAKKEGRWGFIL
jgi:hypothetical protein